MRKSLGVCLLVLLLTGSASAGIMGNDVSAPSQPASAAQDGIIPNESPDSLMQTVLQLLAALL